MRPALASAVAVLVTALAMVAVPTAAQAIEVTSPKNQSVFTEGQLPGR